MSEKERLVKFQLLGQQFTFYTGASEEEMEKILTLVQKLVEEGNGESVKGGTIPASKAAILACLNLASRYIRLRQDFDDYRQNSEGLAKRMINRIGDRLTTEKSKEKL